MTNRPWLLEKLEVWEASVVRIRQGRLPAASRAVSKSALCAYIGAMQERMYRLLLVLFSSADRAESTRDLMPRGVLGENFDGLPHGGMQK